MDGTTRATAPVSGAACAVDGGGARVRDRDDLCPGTLDAARGDDGLIARVRLPGGRLSAAQLRALATGARDLGKGFVDLTVRANVQIRGLSPEDVGGLGVRLAEAGLMPSPAHDRVRNITASPFAGRDSGALVDAERLVTALDAALCADPELAVLPGRFQFAVDGGGVRVATARHDIALVAIAPDAVALFVAGVDTGLRAHAGTAAELALTAARSFLHAREPSGAWHVRELPCGADAFAASLREGRVVARGDGGMDGAAFGPGPGRMSRAGEPPVGVVVQGDGRYAVSALVPLGRLTADQLVTLADIASGAAIDRAPRVRFAPWRGVVVADIVPGRETHVVARLDALGLPTSATSAWHGLSACSGLGECRRARTDIRALAREFAARPHNVGADPALGAVHFAACARACGRPAGASTVIAVEGPAEGDRVAASPEEVAATAAGFAGAFDVASSRADTARALAEIVAALRPNVPVTIASPPPHGPPDPTVPADDRDVPFPGLAPDRISPTSERPHPWTTG